MSDDFTFPDLLSGSASTSSTLSKPPLTAKSTVAEATVDGSIRSAQPLPARQPIRRQKVPLEKGFSQVDWLRLSRTHPDLAGVGASGIRKDIPMAEVKQHNTSDDAWLVLRGKVFNITHYLNYHPGGADILVKVAGRDGTLLFQKYHPWVNADALLEKCFVGLLAPKPLAAPAPAASPAPVATTTPPVPAFSDS